MANKEKAKTRFLFTLLAILLISGAAFCAVSLPRRAGEAEATGGVFDLTGADLSKTLYTLDGEWEFYYGRLYTPEDFALGEPEGKTFINVPETWGNQGYPTAGFATYRLTLRADEPELMLLIPEIPDAGVVFVSGRRVFTAGAVSDSDGGAGTVVAVRNAFVPFETVGGRAEIIIQASNAEWMESGICYSIEMGRPGALQGDAFFRRVVLAGFLGVAFAMFLYHMALFLHRRSEKAYPAFAMVCLIIVLRFAMETNGLVQLFHPKGMGAFLTALYLSLLPLHAAAITLFTHTALRLPLKNKIVAAIYALTLAVPAVLPFISPNPGPFVYTSLIPMAMAAVSAARSKTLRENPYNGLYLAALIIFIIWAPLTKRFLGDALFMPGAASNLFLILSQCVMLSIGYADAREKEQELTVQNAILWQTARIRADMLGVLSHEVRTPLTVMSAYAQYVVEDMRRQQGGIDRQTEQDLAAISEEAKRLSELTTNALRLSRMGATETANGEAPLETSAFNIGEAVRLIAGLFRPVMEKQGRALTLSLPDDMPDVNGNADALSRLLWNLLDNALTHGEYGDIEVNGGADGCNVRIVVKDGGVGIPPELLSHVFERGVSGKSDGAGIGLALCKEIALRHGGDVTVESEPGKGTAAALFLPIYRDGGGADE
ncbi:MAG: sensor histidine kinase [Oscillospiraceae bacterium]|jgi:signal transduction histidine kinase|nr:sensor histidine kinase [Oscillospiraceae bacterium]